MTQVECFAGLHCERGSLEEASCTCEHSVLSHVCALLIADRVAYHDIPYHDIPVDGAPMDALLAPGRTSSELGCGLSLPGDIGSSMCFVWDLPLDLVRGCSSSYRPGGFVCRCLDVQGVALRRRCSTKLIRSCSVCSPCGRAAWCTLCAFEHFPPKIPY